MARLAVLTSGGDAPGMNPVLRGFVRRALHAGAEVFAVREGYDGLVNGWLEPASWNLVAGIQQLGGTLAGGEAIEEDIFTAAYDRGFPKTSKFGSFILNMPEAFAAVLLNKAPKITFYAQSGVAYRCVPEAFEITEKLKDTDGDTIRWAWIDIPKFYTQSDQALETKISNELAKRAFIKLTKFYRPCIKGTKIKDNRCRIEFAHGDNFYGNYLKNVTHVNLAWEGLNVKLEMAVRFNLEYCRQERICPRNTCYKLRQDAAPLNTPDRDICCCKDRGLGDGKDFRMKRARDQGSSSADDAAAAWRRRQAANMAKATARDPFA